MLFHFLYLIHVCTYIDQILYVNTFIATRLNILIQAIFFFWLTFENMCTIMNYQATLSQEFNMVYSLTGGASADT